MAPPMGILDSTGHQEAFKAVEDEWEVLHYDLQYMEVPLWGQYKAGQLPAEKYAKVRTCTGVLEFGDTVIETCARHCLMCSC